MKKLARPSLVLTALVGLLAAANASAAQAPRTVALKVSVTGSGTLHLAGHSFTCRRVCNRTFQIPRGKRIVIRASAPAGWKLTKWSGPCNGSAGSCSLRLKRRETVAVSFVPPGNRLNPYPLGTAVVTSDGWTVKVNSATLDADSQVEAVNNQPPPPAGEQYTLVDLTMTAPMGGGPFDLHDFLFFEQQMQANFQYAPDTCEPPPPDLGTVGLVTSGASVTGNLCYEIATKDAATLMLTGFAPTGTSPRPVWFALS